MWWVWLGCIRTYHIVLHWDWYWYSVYVRVYGVVLSCMCILFSPIISQYVVLYSMALCCSAVRCGVGYCRALNCSCTRSCMCIGVCSCMCMRICKLFVLVLVLMLYCDVLSCFSLYCVCRCMRMVFVIVSYAMLLSVIVLWRLVLSCVIVCYILSY